MAKVTCKICKGKIEKEQAFCIEKVSEKTGKVSRSYYCSREEYEKDKFLKSLWRELLLLYDDILGYTCISKTKVNMIKELEENYSREQIYNCLKANADSIKRYLDEKGIYEEYGKLCYITSAIKNKIKDYTTNEISFKTFDIDCDDISFETDEQIIRRIDNERQHRKQSGILKILDKLDKK